MVGAYDRGQFGRQRDEDPSGMTERVVFTRRISKKVMVPPGRFQQFAPGLNPVLTVRHYAACHHLPG